MTIKNFILRNPILLPVARRLTRLYSNGSVTSIRSGIAKDYKWRRFHSQVNGYWRGDYEPQTQKALLREVKEGDVVFDVGANSGFFALVLSVLVGPEGKVVAVDPDPEFVAQIKDVIALNKLQNVEVEQLALSNFEGECNFTRDCGSKQRFAEETKENVFKTKVTTLDWLASKQGLPDLVLLDVEGAEADVLKAAEVVLSERKTKFLIETHERENDKGVQIARDLRKAFSEKKYEIFDVSGQKPQPDSARHHDILPHHIIASSQDARE